MKCLKQTPQFFSWGVISYLKIEKFFMLRPRGEIYTRIPDMYPAGQILLQL